MTAITEDSIVRVTLAVGTTAQFNAHKIEGFTGWNTDLGALVSCPADGADFVVVGPQSPQDPVTTRQYLSLHRNGGREWSIYPTARTAFTDYRYSQMAYSGTRFVQTFKGTTQALYRYSSDALTWTEANMPVSANWTGIVWCASSSLFVAVGYAGGGAGVIYTSPNGITWTSRTTTAEYLYGVAVNVNVLVACANGGGYSARSADGGLTWSAIGDGGWNYNNVFFLNGKFILLQGMPSVGSNGTVTSADGITWDTPGDHTLSLVSSHCAHPMAHFNGKYWCGTASLYASSDAKNWESVPGTYNPVIPSGIVAWETFVATSTALYAVVEDSSGVRTLLRTNEGMLWEKVGPCDFFQEGTIDLSNLEYLPDTATLLATGYLPDANFSAFAYA